MGLCMPGSFPLFLKNFQTMISFLSATKEPRGYTKKHLKRISRLVSKSIVMKMCVLITIVM